jgi:hypothetical protein
MLSADWLQRGIMGNYSKFPRMHLASLSKFTSCLALHPLPILIRMWAHVVCVSILVTLSHRVHA